MEKVVPRLVRALCALLARAVLVRAIAMASATLQWAIPARDCRPRRWTGLTCFPPPAWAPTSAGLL